jgi:hypothetical protein
VKTQASRDTETSALYLLRAPPLIGYSQGAIFLYFTAVSIHFFSMITVNVIETEYTPVGDMAELLLDKHVEPALGMMLIDEKGDTWEVTGTLSDGQRNTTDSSMRRWTFQVKPVNTDDNIHTGLFKLMH